MKSAKTATDNATEIAVLARAQRNFRNDGLGDRMWADPGSTEESTLSEAFFLSEEERASFIAAAQVEIEIENRSLSQADVTISQMKGDT